MKAKVPPREGRFAYEGLDRVIHERARLSVLTSLITNPKGLTFGDLKQLCGLTDGNLSRHLQVLEKESMVDIVKGSQPATDHVPHHGAGPQTLSRIPFHSRAGGSRCRESNKRRARLQLDPRPHAYPSLTFFFAR
jgi:hypothetical protein